MADKAILIIDSPTKTVEDMTSTLESEDYLVFTASSVEIAVAMARKVKPAMIVINPAMAGASGLEICKSIHETDELSHIPIVALASFEGELDPRYRSEYGIVALLRTPFTHEDLLSKTEHVLSMTAGDTGAVPAPEGEVPETPGAPQEVAGPHEIRPEKGGGSDRIVVRVKEMKEEEKAEKTEIPAAEPEPLQEPQQEEEPLKGKKDDWGFVARKPVRRQRSSGSRLTVPIIAVVLLVLLGAAGLVVYKMGFLGDKNVKKQTVATPPAPVQQQPAVPPPAPVEKPEQKAAQEETVPPAVPSPPSAAGTSSPPSQERVKKPAGRAVYSVQLGAFKNESNAEALVKQYKEKGYDAFVQTTPRDKEMFHRVLIGKFENRKEASKLAEEIKEKEKVKAVVTGE